MNKKVLVDNLDKLEGVEREEAEALLKALGIDFARKPKPSRSKFTTKIKPYYERITIICRTCGLTKKRHFYHTEKIVFGQHSLVALPTNATTYEDALREFEDCRVRHAGRTVCPRCTKQLHKWTKEELVATILNMRLGGDYAKITSEG